MSGDEPDEPLAEAISIEWRPIGPSETKESASSFRPSARCSCTVVSRMRAGKDPDEDDLAPNGDPGASAMLSHFQALGRRQGVVGVAPSGVRTITPLPMLENDAPVPSTSAFPTVAIPDQHGAGSAGDASRTPDAASRTSIDVRSTGQLNVIEPAAVVGAKDAPAEAS